MGRTAWVRTAAILVLVLGTAALNAQEKLEIYYWPSGDGDPGLQALVQLYNERFPDVAVTNAAAAAAPGTDPREELRARMLAGDPPDTFEVHGGQTIIGTWVAANRMEDLAGFFRTQGLMSRFPRSFVSLLSTKTGIWSVPYAVNRTNVIWFIPSRLAGWGIQPPSTWDELIADCRKLREAGLAAPLAVGDVEGLGVLWESAALATLGRGLWDDLWKGRIALSDERVMKAWDAFGAALDFANQDPERLPWQQAMDRLARGDAAFAIMGDWAEKYMSKALKLTPGSDFGWASAPGTAGVFMAGSESFGLPRGGRNRASILKWLVLVSSRDGQDAFNPPEGSISPRIDSDLSRYDAYGRSAAADWRKDAIVGSLVTGTVAPETFARRFPDAINVYLAGRDARAAANAAQAIAEQEGLEK